MYLFLFTGRIDGLVCNCGGLISGAGSGEGLIRGSLLFAYTL